MEAGAWAGITWRGPVLLLLLFITLSLPPVHILKCALTAALCRWPLICINGCEITLYKGSHSQCMCCSHRQTGKRTWWNSAQPHGPVCRRRGSSVCAGLCWLWGGAGDLGGDSSGGETTAEIWTRPISFFCYKAMVCLSASYLFVI